MIADILTFKGFRGWSCGETYESLRWDDAEAGRAHPSQAEIAEWEVERIAAKAVEADVQKRQKIELQRDTTLAAGLTWNGNKYHIDQTMIAALNGRLTLWQEGKIAADAKLPIRRMDNVIELLDRKQHAELADALRLHGEAIYAASWVEKDKLK